MKHAVNLPDQLSEQRITTGVMNGGMKQGVHGAPILAVAMCFQQDVGSLPNVFSLMLAGIAAGQAYRFDFQRSAYTVGRRSEEKLRGSGQLLSDLRDAEPGAPWNPR